MKNYCIGCNKLLLNRSKTNPPKRCWNCRVKYLKSKATGGETGKRHYCKICNNKVSYRSWRFGNIHCRICAGKLRRGKNHPSYGKPSKMPNCIDCGKKLKDYRSKRCTRCSSIIGLKTLWKKMSPNKPEQQLNELLNKWFPNDYKYVGNGKVIIGSFNPDFINCNGKKIIIELFGDYWHNRSEIKKRDKRRLEVYKRYGYKTLIVWEHELKDLEKLKQDINRTING